MKNFIKIVCGVLFLVALCTQANALVKARKKVLNAGSRLWVTSFIDYPPFGTLSKYRDGIDTVFQPFIDVFNASGDNEMQYFASGTYDNLIFDTVSGRVDVILGAYYDTRKYDGLELVYPSLLNNPLVVVTMPDNNLNIKTKDDLKKLKGAMDSREYIADYVTNELKSYKIQKFDNSEKLYEQLFIGNVDYILTSRYYGALEQAKLGIRDMVQMSKKAVWDMPLFIAVSKVTRKGPFTANTIREVIKTNQKKLKQQIEQRVVDEIRKADEASVGIVPPAYVK